MGEQIKTEALTAEQFVATLSEAFRGWTLFDSHQLAGQIGTWSPDTVLTKKGMALLAQINAALAAAPKVELAEQATKEVRCEKCEMMVLRNCDPDGIFSGCPVPKAALASRAAPIDMVLFCPKCGLQHIDAPEGNDRYLAKSDPPSAWSMPPWKNEPHRSHLCHGCDHIWRPADVPTNGVAAVKTKGKNDSPIASRAAPPAEQQGEARDWAKIESIVAEFIDGYEMVGETEDGRDACYTPNENERALLHDCIAGLLAEPEFVAALASRAAPQASGETALEAFDRAIAEELPRVSHVPYDSHEICKHFAKNVRGRLAAPRASGDAAVTLTWVESGFDKRLCHDADGKVRGYIKRGISHTRWAAVAGRSIGEFMTEAQAKTAVERAALKAAQSGERGEGASHG